jgi:hypothetical protein
VRDVILNARRGLPGVALVTSEFWEAAAFVASSAGMANAPRLKTPHPLAGTGVANLRAVADALAPDILRVLHGGVAG